MKTKQRNLFLSLLAAFILIGFSTTATAQTRLLARNDKQADVTPVAEVEPATDEPSTNFAEADTRASRNFSKEFAGVSDANWAKTNDGYVVWFTKEGILNQAFLTKKGNSHTIVRYYTENELPATVRKQVKRAYADFNITSVTEVHLNNLPTVYLIAITGINTWKEIRVVNGEIDVRGEYVKG